jgi:CRP-like cAMP-binding protein
LCAGDSFGDSSLFDHGPRSADVVANSDSLVVKITAATLDRLAGEAPEIATPILRVG